MKLYLLFISLILSTLNSFGQSDTLDNRLKTSSKKIILWSTYYYLPTLNHDEKGIELLDQNEKGIGLKLDSCDWCEAAIEGTVFIKKGEKTYVLNYAGRSKNVQLDCRLCKKYSNYDNYSKTGKVLWSTSSGFGKGVMNYNIVPFKTIAVDSSIIPYGTVIYIPLAKGVSYLNAKGETEKHDGLFFAGDTGSKIIGNHIDVFIGTNLKNPFEFIQSSSNGTFDAYIVQDKKLTQEIEELHR
jgi:3D (Asp-Asp-Asp) domain-containing protein